MAVLHASKSRPVSDDAATGRLFVLELSGGRIRAMSPDGSDRNVIYFAFVNYTTLGYGDVTPVERWQLLGPMTAMNGVLLFGWSTAVIFEVLRRALMTIHSEEGHRE
jgi:hypothetical protein